MYEIISRETAGLFWTSGNTAINQSYIKGLTVHYTGAAIMPSMKSIDDVFTYLTNLQDAYVNKAGFVDIPYSFAISNVTDEIIELRGFGIQSEHSRSNQLNNTFMSVLWLGAVRDVPNENAKVALERLVDILTERYNRKMLVEADDCGEPMYQFITSTEPKWKIPKRKVRKWSRKKKKIIKQT
jgi:hypothetical protein